MKKLLSAILTICLVLSCTAPALAASFPDLEARHAWAVPAIDYMMSKGIVNGYEDDTFRPDRTVTRVEFIKMLNMTFGLTATAAIPYTDVPADQWYAPYVKQAVAQGYLLNYGSLLNPNGALSRQEAAALLVRYLNPDESLKASTTTFKDYSSIKTSYRDYVLLAAGIGLINGYEDDTFKPDKTLNRAEALAILYRAAGMICNDNVVETEAGAGDKNAVVIKNNITVTGANLPGRVIITEGVSGGTVTLSECIIGELIVRGTPTVILSGCTVDSLIVDCSSKGKTAPLSLLAGTVVKDMTLRTPADISTASRTTLTKLTVDSGASRSTLSGSGTFTTAVINASGFVSDKMPTNYTLGKGISATFAGNVYTSSSAPSASDTGFTTQPSLYTASSYTYLTLTAAKAGTVHYYYTNTSTVPTAELFENYYAVAAVRSNFMVSANRSLDTQIGSTAAVGSYSHVVVRFTDAQGVDYQPIVLSNQSPSGFTVAPTVSTNGSYQYLAFTPAIDGTLYYYYTNSSTPLTATSFISAFTSGAAMHTGDIDVSVGKSVSTALAVASTVSNYAYVAVMLEDNFAKTYQPMLIPTGGTGANSATGFTDNPYCNTLNNGVALGFTPTYSGVVEYYFTTGSTVPTTSEFEYYKSISQVTLTGSLQVTAGTASYAPLLNTVNPSMYPYIVIRLKSTSGTAYTPVVIRISTTPIGGGTTTPGTTGSGFTTMPTVTYAAGKYVLNFQAGTSGTVYYYLTTGPNSPGAAFMGNYNSSTSAMTSTKLGGALTATGMAQSASTVLSTSHGENYDYMAIMLQSGNTAYTPVVVPVPDAEAVVIQDTGFVIGPIYNEVMAQANYFKYQIEFISSMKGTVWYYFTDSAETPTSTDVIEAVLYGGDSITDSGRQNVRKNSTTIIPFTSTTAPAANVVLMMVDENDNYYRPVVLAANGMFGASLMTSGFSGTPTASVTAGMPVLNYACVETGKLYYYFTTGAPNINTMWDFFGGYLSTQAEGVKGTMDLAVGKGNAYLTTSKSTSGYSHVVIMMQSTAYAPGGYRKPVVIALGASGSSGTSSSYSGFTTSPYLSGTLVYFTPKSHGTVYYGFTQTNNTTELYASWGNMGSLGAIGGAIGTANVSSFLASANHGGSMPISLPGYSQSITIPASHFNNYKYMALWTVDSSDTMSKVEFIPLSNASIGGTTLPTTGTGFMVAPSYNAATRQLSFTTSAAGTVAYACTDSPSITTFEQFQTAFNNALVKNTVTVTAFQPTTMTVNVSLNKYVWVMLITVDGNYTPVRVQLY